MANQNNNIAKHKQPEKKLKIEKESAEQYLDIAGVIIVALNNKGETTLLNKKGYEVLQYEEGELLGKNWFYVVDLSHSVLFQSKSEFERLGMGLAIVKEYVAMLGGKICAESRVGEGSIFHILFPKKK